MKSKIKNFFKRGAGSEATQSSVWEDLISLHSAAEPDFKLLAPAAEHFERDTRKEEWRSVDFKNALAHDVFPLPTTSDREGYYGPDHFSYWASGFVDAQHMIDLASAHGMSIKSYLDIGCASGRVMRHMALDRADRAVIGCDINRLHVEWCNANLPPNCTTFQNSSVPSLPLEDGSIDFVSAFSVFTHIEALETAWLMELKRILRPHGIAWITVHTEHTLANMNEDWPLWKPTMDHPDARVLLDADRRFVRDRLVLRWRGDRSYSSNVFYKLDYIKSHWGRIMDILEVRHQFPTFQDVIIMRKADQR
tara:strand:- start:1476 stop:2396 length:921 start_codon:yes stop_codon:yes gene_type:complete